MPGLLVRDAILRGLRRKDYATIASSRHSCWATLLYLPNRTSKTRLLSMPGMYHSSLSNKQQAIYVVPVLRFQGVPLSTAVRSRFKQWSKIVFATHSVLYFNFFSIIANPQKQRRSTMAATRRSSGWIVALAALASGVSLGLLYLSHSRGLLQNAFGIKKSDFDSYIETPGIVPSALMGVVYNQSDFRNQRGVIPPFWECDNGSCNSTSVWGPCFAPSQNVRWSEEVANFQRFHNPHYDVKAISKNNPQDVSNLCRPGFVIIGAGKCGTR